MRKYVDENTLSAILNKQMEDYVLLAQYNRQDITTIPNAEKFTITLPESIENFMFIFFCVRATGYAMGCSTVPTKFFKNSGLWFELNCMNDQEKLFCGNVQYVNDTTVSGKISEESTGFEVYGILRVGE